MAYYDKAPQKRKKINYGEMGSWDEEGTHYKKPGGARKQQEGQRSAGRREESRYDRPQKQRTSMKNAEPREKRAPSGVRKYTRQEDTGFERKPRDYRQYEFQPAPEQIPAAEEESRILCGRNPIREALRSGRGIEKLLVQKGELGGSAQEIVMEARSRKIVIQELEKRKLDEIAPHHQGLIAYASAYQYAEVEDILQTAREKQEDPFIIILDGITDPHNLGAIIRTAECTGAHGVILPIHRSVGLTPAAVKASAGAIEHIKVARVVNLNRTIDDLKQAGIWTYAVTMDGKDYEKVDFRGGTALIIGSEGSGISRLTEEKCDLSVSLPMNGVLDSLNASVAAGVVMYRVLSCRRKNG